MPVGGLGGAGPGQSELGAAPSRLCWVDDVQGLSLELGSEGRWEGMVPEGPGPGAPLLGSEKAPGAASFPSWRRRHAGRGWGGIILSDREGQLVKLSCSSSS